jgi:hypothetical protein
MTLDPRLPSALAAAHHTIVNGGGTFDAVTLTPLTPDHGYAVGLVTGTWRTIGSNVSGPWDYAAIAAAILAAADYTARHYAARGVLSTDARYVGTWIDGGVIHIDPVAIVDDIREALALGVITHQQSVWAFAEGIAIDSAARAAVLGILHPADPLD